MSHPPIFVLTTSSPKGKERCRTLLRNFDAVGISHSDLQFVSFPSQKKLVNDGSVRDLFSILNHSSQDETSRVIYNNHVSLIRLAHHYGWEEIMIFEDDARFHPTTPDSWKRCVEWKQENRDWDVFYYGYCQWPVLFSVPIRWDILRLSSPLTTHAYSIHRRGIEKLVAHLDRFPECRTQHIDKVLSVLPLHKYGIFPMISFQSEDPALYRRAVDMLPVLHSLSFGSLCVISEYTSLLWIVCLVTVVGLVIYRRVQRSR